MKGYEVKIVSTIKDMTARERINVKSLDRAISIDSATENGQEITVTVDNFVELAVHNENAKEGNNKDYNVYVLIATDGTKYRTGSESFYASFCDIYEEMKTEAPDDPIELVIYKQESKNFKGKGFITCSLA